MYQPANNRVVPGERAGFTLIELIVVVAILVLVATAMVGVSSYLQTQKKNVLTRQCLQLLSTAVAEFYDITGHYPIDAWPDDNDWDAQDDDDEYIYTGCRIRDADKSGFDDPKSDELLYLQLSLLPQTRAIIAKLPERLIVPPLSEARVQLAGQTSDTLYLRSIVDPWHKEDDQRPLLYKRDADGGWPPIDPDTVFPKIWSSGPDGESDPDDTESADNLDDITNED